MNLPSQSQNVRANGTEAPIARVVVKFRDEIELPWEDAIEHHIQTHDLGPWEQLARNFPGITLLRNVTNVTPEEFRDLVSRAVELDPRYSAPNFLGYFGIPCSASLDAEALARQLRTWRIVERAWVERTAIGAAAPAGVNGERPNQTYLDPPTGSAAPFTGGIDAVYAWNQCGDGDGQVLVSYERAMSPHEDVVFPAAALAGQTDNTLLYDTPPGHGTAVLGIIAMQDNNIGGVGIAYKLADFQWTSPFDGTPVPIRQNALWAAIKYFTRPGAVPYGRFFLFEVMIPSVTDANGQIHRGMPVEVYDDYYQAIRLATALGIVVIEPAGNGAEDLDAYLDASTGEAVLDPNVRDSGAVVVGACNPTTRTRWTTLPGVVPPGGTNFGRRVNCFAWGHGALTATSDGSFRRYDDFGGTSAASAMIAGAGLVLQTLVEKSTSSRLSGLQMRALLSDPTTGTAAVDASAIQPARIGVMPNLKAIVDTSGFGNSPDVFLRDNLSDTGAVPQTGPLSMSPDLIVLPSVGPSQGPPVADGQAAYGQGSGQEGNDSIGAIVTTGRDHFVYVRVKNRGAIDAQQTVVTVYWSPPATLVTPDLWTLIGTTTPIVVPAGGPLTVPAPLPWTHDKIPAPGHYCFIGLAGANGDPQLDPINIPSWLADWNLFLRLIADNNNITWRNFAVLDPATTAALTAGGPIPLEFFVPGAPDRARPFALETVAQLPARARVWLDAPTALIDALGARSPFVHIDGERAIVAIHPHGRWRFGPGPLAAGSRNLVKILVQLSPERRFYGGEVAVRQLYEGVEVGRVTFRLAPPNGRH